MSEDDFDLEDYEFIKSTEDGDEELDETVIEFTTPVAREAFEAGWALYEYETEAVPVARLRQLIKRWRRRRFGPQETESVGYRADDRSNETYAAELADVIEEYTNE